MLIFERELRLPIQLVIGDPLNDTVADVSNYVVQLQERLNIVHEFNRTQLAIASRRMIDHYDRFAKAAPFKVGDRVCLYNLKRKKGLSSKLQSDWDGPYEVIAPLSEVVYGIRQHRAKNDVVIHRDRLGPVRQ